MGNVPKWRLLVDGPNTGAVLEQQFDDFRVLIVPGGQVDRSRAELVSRSHIRSVIQQKLQHARIRVVPGSHV